MRGVSSSVIAARQAIQLDANELHQTEDMLRTAGFILCTLAMLGFSFV